MVLQTPLTKTDGWTLLILLLVGLKFTYGLEQALDITLYDESTYLWQGATLPSRGFDQAKYDLLYAPLYTLWYYLLSLLATTRIDLYYLNYQLMTILPSCLIYLLLRSLSRSVLLSVVVSWLFLTSTVSLETVPKVSHFALLLMLMVLVITSHLQSSLVATLVAANGALLISYTRPEYFLTFLLLSLLLVTRLVFEYRQLKTIDQLTLVKFTLSVIFAILLFLSFGSPLGGDRSIWAFQQHFAVNWVSWTDNRELNPWFDAYHIFSLNFGEAKSIWQALLNNPGAFLKHLSYNAYYLGTALSDVWFSPLLFAKDTVSKTVAVLFVISLSVFYRARIYRHILKYKWFLILSSSYLLSALVAIILIYPRVHYLLIPGVLIAIIAIILLTDSVLEKPPMTWQLLPYMLVAMLMFTPSPFIKNLGTPAHANLEVIRFMTALNIQKPINMLEIQGGYCYYLSNNCQWVTVFEKDVNFKQFLANKQINMILVTAALNSDTKFRDDQEWRSFLKDFPTFGFTLLVIPKTKDQLLIHTSLLH